MKEHVGGYLKKAISSPVMPSSLYKKPLIYMNINKNLLQRGIIQKTRGGFNYESDVLSVRCGLVHSLDNLDNKFREFDAEETAVYNPISSMAEKGGSGKDINPAEKPKLLLKASSTNYNEWSRDETSAREGKLRRQQSAQKI